MLLCAFSVNYAAASGRTDHPRYGPALEIVDRPSANLARFRGTKTVSQAWTFQTLNEGAQASRAYRRAPSVVDLGARTATGKLVRIVLVPAGKSGNPCGTDSAFTKKGYEYPSDLQLHLGRDD